MPNKVVSFRKAQIEVELTPDKYANDFSCPLPVKAIFDMSLIIIDRAFHKSSLMKLLL